MSIETLFLFILIAFVLISLPAWGYSKSWGYRPTGVLTVLLVIFLIWAIAGGRPLFRRSIGHDFRAAGHDMADSVKRDVR
jgi:hypothetical protein